MTLLKELCLLNYSFHPDLREPPADNQRINTQDNQVFPINLKNLL